jgi:hypothetical protein
MPAHKSRSTIARVAWNGLKWFAVEMLVSLALFAAACVIAVVALLVGMYVTGGGFGD